MVDVAVVTVVRGRHAHLRAQRAGLARSTLRPLTHVVVSLGDDALPHLLEGDGGPPVCAVSLPADPQRLPLAAGRNAGAAAALAAGAQVLVFLDVDCVPAADLLARYARAATEVPAALLAGPVTYLPPRAPERWDAHTLAEHRSPHPARPDPPPGDLVPGEVDLFWSLSFAVTAEAWTTIGGFDEGYAGYGAEDTDFALRAEAAGAALTWVGGADAFHLHHPTSNPPVQHADAILTNGARFAARWGRWPMPGWLAGLAERGLIEADGAGWRRAAPVRVASVPARHPYVDAIRPTAGCAVRPERVTAWEPDPLLDPAYLRAAAGEIDVVHLHFGYDESPDLLPWTAEVRRLGLPLVLTVHDLRDPHRDDNARHEAHLAVLTGAADEVITLTDGAAREIRRRYGRRARVLAHPTLLPEVPVRGAETGPRTVLVPLKSLRRNVRDPGALVLAAAWGAQVCGLATRVRVDIHPEVAHRAELGPVRELAERGEVDLHVHGRWDDEELLAVVAAAHALVLPYAFGTHSGWVELARDVGTRVIAPRFGHYAEQGVQVIGYDNDERDGLRPASLATAVARALSEPRPAPADRAGRVAEQALVRAEHEVLYRRLMRR